MDLTSMGIEAKNAFQVLSRTGGDQRRKAVLGIAEGLENCLDDIKIANEMDIAAAKVSGLHPALIDRLTLTEPRLDSLIAAVRALAEWKDTIGEIMEERIMPNGLQLYRRRVPLGVLGVIYESRPNVTIDVASLAIKTGNTVILRGGKETIHSNRVLVQIVRSVLRGQGLPENAVQFIDSPERALVGEMLRLNDYIDVIVPRGGNSLHDFCRKNANIPVITGGIGICHLYVDESADLAAALPLIHNAKTQRPSVCNSLDTLLVNEKIAAEFLPQVVEFLSKDGVTFRASADAIKHLNHESVEPARPEDFDIEWLSLVLGLKTVPNLDAAMAHIQVHSTFHSDGILTCTPENADRFIQEMDSAAVFVNASTRFNDGGQFGLGAEVAVSTQRLHARGPMGLPELTTYKWVVIGDYTIRD